MATWDVKLIAIGNSLGIRLPSAVLQKYGWGDPLVLEETGEDVLLSGTKSNKLSWTETYRAMADDSEDWRDLDTAIADGLG